MGSTGRLSKALQSVAPNEADKLKRAGREARDARRRDADPDVDEAVTSRIAATLRKKRREDPVRGLTIAQKTAERAAKKVAAEFDVSPEERAKIEAYHHDRIAESEAQGSNKSSDERWDVKANSLARRERNAILREAAMVSEDDAKADWRAHVGSKEKSGLGWNAHRREAAALDAPLEPNTEADAAALEKFKTAATDGTLGFMQPVIRSGGR